MSALASLQVDSLLSYAAAIVFPALDAVLPVLPSETIVITLGVATAGSADPRIALLVACAAAGAFLGDNLCYVLGRRFGPWIDRRFFRSEKGAKQRAWAIQSLERYGIPLIVACRFIPGGRTAVMLSCGIVRYDRRRFIIATAIAGVIWACYAFFIGRLGGKAFEDKPWAGLLLAFGGTLAISALIELVRRLRARWVRRRAAAQGQGAAQGQDDTVRQGDAQRHAYVQDPANVQGHADSQDPANVQGHADSQDPANVQGHADSQGHGDDRECGTPSSDDAPRTPVR